MCPARLICRNIPNASSVPRLVLVTKMIAWLIIADKDDDHPNVLGADDLNTAHHASQVLSILYGSPAAAAAPAALSRAPGEPFTAGMPEEHALFEISKKRNTKREAALLALAELWGEMREEMSPRLRARFISTMEDYFGAVELQARYCKANCLPKVQAYKEIRRQASFILPCFVLVEYALGIELDDATCVIQEFRNAATDYICLCNDLISCKAEIRVGDYFNMPSILYTCGGATRGGMTLQAAVDTVADMTQDLDARCVSMLRTMSKEAAAAGSTLKN